jgi:hypothetical protein
MDQQTFHAKQNTVIRKIACKVEASYKNYIDDVYWAEASDGALGIRVRTEVLLQCLRQLDPKYSKAWLAQQIYNRFETGRIPRKGNTDPTRSEVRSFDPKTDLWDKVTVESWFTRNQIRPSSADAEYVLEKLAELADDRLARRGSAGEILKIVRDRTLSIYLMVHAVVTSSVIGADTVWKPRLPSFVPRIAETFMQPPAAAPTTFLNTAKEVVEFLSGISGPRVALFSGSVHSGKKTALRYLVSELSDGHLILENRVKIPALAINLEDITHEQFVDEVFDFYARDSYSSVERAAAMQLSANIKIERIREMAVDTPACIIIGEIGRLDGDEIIRRLAGNYAEEIVSALLRGHELTRLVLSSHVQWSRSFRREIARLCEYCKGIDLPQLILHCQVGLPLSSLLGHLGLPHDIAASGLSWKLAYMSIQLAQATVSEGQLEEDLVVSLRALLTGDDTEGLVRLILARLTETERFVFGLVCSSSDGVRFSTLQKMVRTFAYLLPQRRTLLDPLETGLENILGSLGPLLSCRMSAIEPGLVSFGAFPRERLFSVHESWRNIVLAEWWDRDVEAGTLAMWLIAREAADQSRLMRTVYGGRSPASIGRDVQALYALIASCHRQWMRLAEPIDPSRCVEENILPPLDICAKRPHPAEILRYAFVQLYGRDLEGDDFSLLNVAEDAKTRLRILMTFLLPDSPWVPADERTLSTDLIHYRHLTGALEPFQLIDLLTSTALAALRLQKFDILSRVCRLGFEIYVAQSEANRPKLMLNLMRLFRAEIDAAVLLGGNPDVYLKAKLEAGPQASVQAIEGLSISDIATRIKWLLANIFSVEGPEDAPIQLLMARGKLKARLAAVLHIEGKLHAAGREFEEAAALEILIRKRQPADPSISPVFGGQGNRSCIAYNLDLACMDESQELWSSFIFLDELPVPIIPRISATNPHLQRAMRLFESNARRLHNGRASDKVGMQIDAARLAVAEHQYARAFRLLDLANGARFGSGSSLEVLLELFGVQSRNFLDAAVICFNKNAEGAVFRSEHAIVGLREYLGEPGECSALRLAELLLKRAKSSLDSYGRLAFLHGNVMTPHVTHVRYLFVLQKVISSRMANMDPVKLLTEADEELDRVIYHLEVSSFLLHLNEAKRLKAGIEGSLAHYRRHE